jgi:ABC-type multidrug transport system fused ATPase/permease subunit
MSTIKKFFYILNSDQKKRSFYLIILLICCSFLEILGISAFLPVINLISGSQEKLSYYNNFLSNYFGYLQTVDANNLLIFFIFLIFILQFLKLLFLLFTSKIQSNLINNISSFISKNLFNNFIHQDYSFFLKNNSSILINKILNETQHLVNNCLSASFIIFSEFLIMLSMCALLFYYNPKSFLLSFFSLFFFSLIFIFITKKNIVHLSKTRQEYQAFCIKELQEGFRAIKDIKMFNKEKEFFLKFNSKIDTYSKCAAKIQYISMLPRLFLEFITILVMLFLVVFLFFSGSPLSDILVLLALYALTAFRILPSINRLLSSYQSLSFGLLSLDTIYNDYKFFSNNKVKNSIVSESKKIFFKKSIDLKNITFVYSQNKKVILNNVSLSISANTTVGIIGESGSGKTTLIDIIVGLLKPSSGKILVDGKEINFDEYQWKNNIGYVPQNIYLLDDSIKKNIAFGYQDFHIDEENIISSSNISETDEFVKLLPKKYDTIVGEAGVNLSGGQKQRIGIARAFYNNSNFIALDEATSSLDFETEEKIMSNIFKMKEFKTILISAHKLALLKNCDYIYEVKNGEVKEYIPQE